jgi:hypothetical protein
MNKTFRNVFASAALVLFAAGSASAGVVTSSKDVTYTATLSGSNLTLTIDAADNGWKAKELDVLMFSMANLSGVKLLSSPTPDWTYDFTDKSGKNKDMATFTAAESNHTFLTEPLEFTFEFAGTNLDFSNLGLKATFLANGGQSESIALDVTAADAGADVPEPASAALLLGGLGLMGALRRKARRG